MKTIDPLLFLFLKLIPFALVASALCAEQADDVLIKKHVSRHQEFEWRISSSQMLKTPEWDIDQDPAPLDPAAAWKAAKKLDAEARL